MRNRVRHSLAAVVVALVVVTSDCGATEPTLTPDQARRDLVEFVVDSTQHVNAEHWSADTGTATPQECTLANGQPGAAYHFRLWSSDRSSRAAGEAERLADYWESLGVTTRVVDHGGHPVVYGTGGPMVRASFDTDAAGGSYGIGAVAPCTPGNAADLKRQANKQREDGARFPGDDYVPEANIQDRFAD